ncbi:hypothetical protein TD95_001562 [Thielaviopsis punctulata]|uniref:YMC020W-like alpha/beta hydrolase domain-containing protein n=1 Tax=Thielaviopsis punctulata TaxID=72032 RepID=A0A0F4ZDS9_9PEZI|nr:hypothetical protein TD95_001562 [Thielaviopsis punctulata]
MRLYTCSNQTHLMRTPLLLPATAAAAGWFSYSYWYGSTAQMPPNDPPKTTDGPELSSKLEPEPSPKSAQEHEPDKQVTTDAPAITIVNAKPPASGSTWAFWSRQAPATETSSSTPQPEDGTIAVIGEASEANPKPATHVEPPAPQPERKKKSSDISASKKRHSDTPAQTSPSTPPPDAVRPRKSQADMSLRRKAGSTASLDSVSSDLARPSLLLPAFEHTYMAPPPPSLAKQITNLILRAPAPSPKHVYAKSTGPARPIRRAISIGVHGLFPAAYLRPMVGQPTGTSLRFATLGAEAIERWTVAHGFAGCEIEKVALEGEGKIGERVENLWRLLLNWLELLKRADLILVSCHSQGVPVGIMLVAKLLELGILSPSTHIGVCAMAGVCLGPFPDYKSSMGILMGSAAELWEFSNPESSVSLLFESSLKSVLRHGVRITFVGSIDDQLVPMESAVYSPATHPYIYRAVFIDGRLHAPDFIAHLVGFALKLRNLGASDHGLIRELSVPLAGSLYGGEGHSRLYYDERVYDLALANVLQTTSVGRGVECVMGVRERVGAANPYVLPWVMRGLLEEDLVKTRLTDETELLLRQFDEWKPATKALKDVKYRLEAVRSRL